MKKIGDEGDVGSSNLTKRTRSVIAQNTKHILHINHYSANTHPELHRFQIVIQFMYTYNVSDFNNYENGRSTGWEAVISYGFSKRP